MQFIEIIAVGGVKVEILKDSLDVLLFNNDARYLDNIIFVVLDNNIDNFIDLCNLFGGILFGEKAILDTLLDSCDSFFAEFLFDLFLLEVTKRNNAFGGDVGNSRFNGFANLGYILLRLFADFSFDLFNLLLDFLFC